MHSPRGLPAAYWMSTIVPHNNQTRIARLRRGSHCALGGCINDAHCMMYLLKSRFGFQVCLAGRLCRQWRPAHQPVAVCDCTCALVGGTKWHV